MEGAEAEVMEGGALAEVAEEAVITARRVCWRRSTRLPRRRHALFRQLWFYCRERLERSGRQLGRQGGNWGNYFGSGGYGGYGGWSGGWGLGLGLDFGGGYPYDYGYSYPYAGDYSYSDGPSSYGDGSVAVDPVVAPQQLPAPTAMAPTASEDQQQRASEALQYYSEARADFLQGDYRNALRLAGHAGVEAPRNRRSTN